MIISEASVLRCRGVNSYLSRRHVSLHKAFAGAVIDASLRHGRALEAITFLPFCQAFVIPFSIRRIFKLALFALFSPLLAGGPNPNWFYLTAQTRTTPSSPASSLLRRHLSPPHPSRPTPL